MPTSKTKKTIARTAIRKKFKKIMEKIGRVSNIDQRAQEILSFPLQEREGIITHEGSPQLVLPVHEEKAGTDAPKESEFSKNGSGIRISQEKPLVLTPGDPNIDQNPGLFAKWLKKRSFQRSIFASFLNRFESFTFYTQKASESDLSMKNKHENSLFQAPKLFFQPKFKSVLFFPSTIDEYTNGYMTASPLTENNFFSGLYFKFKSVPIAPFRFLSVFASNSSNKQQNQPTIPQSNQKLIEFAFNTSKLKDMFVLPLARTQINLATKIYPDLTTNLSLDLKSGSNIRFKNEFRFGNFFKPFEPKLNLETLLTLAVGNLSVEHVYDVSKQFRKLNFMGRLIDKKFLNYDTGCEVFLENWGLRNASFGARLNYCFPSKQEKVENENDSENYSTLVMLGNIFGETSFSYVSKISEKFNLMAATQLRLSLGDYHTEYGIGLKMKPFENILKNLPPTTSNLFESLKTLEMRMRYDTEKGSGFEFSREISKASGLSGTRVGICGVKRFDQDTRFGLVLSTSY